MATQPKLAMIPSGYKDDSDNGTLYSVLPTDGAGDFDIIRGSDATRINKDGLIEVVTGNTPRLDYTGGGCPSLLLEPARTNLFTSSEAFDNASWIKHSSTTYSNNTISASSGTGFKGLSKNEATQGLQSVYFDVQYTNHQWLQIGLGTNGFDFGYVNIDIKNKIIGIKSGEFSNVKIVDYGSFIRIMANINTTSKTSVFLIFVDNSNSSRADSTSSVGSFKIYRSQLELGSYPTSYIKTTSSQVTRLAETANGAGDASTFNDSEGVLFTEISALANDGTLRTITLGDGSSQNAVSIRLDNQNQITLYVNSGGVSQSSFSANVPTLLFNKCLIKYKQNDFSAFVNGFKIGVDTSGSIFPSGTLNRLNFDVGYGVDDFYGKTKQLQYYNTALTDLELETLTSYTSFNAMALAQNYTI